MIRPPGMSAGMRRLDGPDRAHVQRRTGPAFGENADRARADDERIRQDVQQRARDRREERMVRSDPMAQELVIAILEVRSDVSDLESGMREQLDQRRP